MMIKIAIKNKNMFYRLTAFGFSIIYIFQIFLTVGGGIRFIPITGVTLPLISYGGSSMLSTMLMFFLVQGIYMVAVKEGEKRNEQKAAKEHFEDEEYDFLEDWEETEE